MNTKRPTQTIALHREGRLLHITPFFDQLLLLRSWRLDQTEMPNGRFRCEKRVHLLVGDAMLGSSLRSPWVRSGLAEIVRHIIERRVGAVKCQGEWPAPLPAPANSAVGAPLLDVNLLNFVQATDRGLVQYRQGCVDPVLLISQIANAWPTLKLTILANATEVVMETATKIQKHLPDCDYVTSKRLLAKPPRVLIATPRCQSQLHNCIGDRDIVIVRNAREALGAHMQIALSHARKARIYGFLREEEQLFGPESDLLVPIFSLNRMSIPRHEHCLRPVRVRYQSVQHCPSACEGVDALSLRELATFNPIRVKMILKLARAAAGSGIAASEVPISIEGTHSEYEKDVVIVCGGKRQLRVLQQRVQNPEIRLIESENIESITNLPDVLVNACIGTESAARLTTWAKHAGIVRSCPDKTLSPMIVIDVGDHWHPLLRKHQSRRRDIFETSEWWESGADSEHARIELFLRTRPMLPEMATLPREAVIWD